MQRILRPIHETSTRSIDVVYSGIRMSFFLGSLSGLSRARYSPSQTDDNLQALSSRARAIIFWLSMGESQSSATNTRGEISPRPELVVLFLLEKFLKSLQVPKRFPERRGGPLKVVFQHERFWNHVIHLDVRDIPVTTRYFLWTYAN